MVQNRTVLKVIDNSGAKYVRCLKVLNKKKVGYLGDLIIVSVLSLRRGRGRKIRVKRKDLCLGLITSIKYKKSTKLNKWIILDNSVKRFKSVIKKRITEFLILIFFIKLFRYFEFETIKKFSRKYFKSKPDNVDSICNIF
jgi:hypothetical protein